MIALAQAQLWKPGVNETPDEREERLVIVRARTGDEDSFRWLLAHYRNRAIRLASTVLRREGEAEDVAQEAFIHAFRSIKSLRSNSGFRPWFFRIVVRLSVDRTRSARWRSECACSDIEAPQRQSSSPETAAVVDALLESLSPPLRAALVLREIEGLEYDDIAQVLAIPVGTVRSRLSAAREQFRRLWLADEEEARP